MPATHTPYLLYDIDDQMCENSRCSLNCRSVQKELSLLVMQPGVVLHALFSPDHTSCLALTLSHLQVKSPSDTVKHAATNFSASLPYTTYLLTNVSFITNYSVLRLKSILSIMCSHKGIYLLTMYNLCLHKELCSSM